MPEQTVELVLRLRKELTEQGLDSGPETICWHLAHHHQVRISQATVSRVLTRHGLVIPDPAKHPRSSFLRFEAEQPNETWQPDFTHYRLTRPDGTQGADVEILSWLDDHSRFALSVTSQHRVTRPIVLATFRAVVDRFGCPASTLTDNEMVHTKNLSGGKGGRNGFEHELRRLDVVQKNSRPNHPTTCGEAERFQQALKKWLRDIDIRIIDAATGELLRELIWTQPSATTAPAAHPDHHQQSNEARTHERGSGPCRCLETSQWWS